MAVNNFPIFGGKPETNIANITSGNTSSLVVASPADATNFKLLFTAGTNGGWIDQFTYKWISTASPASGTPNACVIYLWLTDSTGLNARIYHSYSVTAGSAMSATVAGKEESFVYNFANLAAGVKVFASVSQIAANTSLNAVVEGGQFEAQ